MFYGKGMVVCGKTRSLSKKGTVVFRKRHGRFPENERSLSEKRPCLYQTTDAPTFTYLEHTHSRFRSRIVTFHNGISCSSSHSSRNLLYRVRFISLVNQLTQRTRVLLSVIRLLEKIVCGILQPCDCPQALVFHLKQAST